MWDAYDPVVDDKERLITVDGDDDGVVGEEETVSKDTLGETRRRKGGETWLR